jgi:hypothetical protein
MARVSLRRCSRLARSRVGAACAATGGGFAAAALADLFGELGGSDFVFAGLSAGAVRAGAGTGVGAAAGAGVGAAAGAGVGTGTVAVAGADGDAGTGGGGGGWGWGWGCGWAWGDGVVTGGFIDAQPAASRTAINPATKERNDAPARVRVKVAVSIMTVAVVILHRDVRRLGASGAYTRPAPRVYLSRSSRRCR